MVELDGVGEGLHGPFFAGAAHHGLDLILEEALEGVKREDLVEASPAAQQVRSVRLNIAHSNITYCENSTEGIILYDSKGPHFCSLHG